MKTPIEFDYDLWTTEDGKCMVRVKSTGEVTEIDREIMRFLRAEEKRVRRSMTGIPIPGCKDAEETSTLLSLDYVSYEGGEDMSPAWLEDPSSLEESILTGMIEAEFVKTLTVYQRDVYEKCMRDGMSLTEYSRSRGVAVTSIRDTKRLIQKKAKKFFE